MQQLILLGLRPQRERAGLTQRALAARMRVSFGAVAAWETGRNMPSSDKLPVLADVLGCSIGELFEAPEVGEPEPEEEKEVEGCGEKVSKGYNGVCHSVRWLEGS